MKKTKEQIIAEMAKRDNLEKVNKNSMHVYPRDSLYEKYIKRILDIFIALPLNIVLLPVYIVLSIFVYLFVFVLNI